MYCPFSIFIFEDSAGYSYFTLIMTFVIFQLHRNDAGRYQIQASVGEEVASNFS